MHGKIFLATLWAKLLIIAVNFGNKTKVFSENFEWLYVTEHLKRKHLAHSSLKAENKVKKGSRWFREHDPALVGYQYITLIFINANVFRIYFSENSREHHNLVIEQLS